MRNDWVEIELGSISIIFNGNSINEKIKKDKYQNVKKGLNYIGTKDVHFNAEVNYNNGIRIPLEENKFRIAQKGSVLVCSEGGSAGKKTAILNEDVCFGNKLYAITNTYDIYYNNYLFYYTRFKAFFDDFKNQMNGIIGGVSLKKFKTIKIPIAPLPEQRAIVSKIEELFSEIDNGISNLKEAKEKLIIYRQAVLKTAFEGKLTKEWREKNLIEHNWENITTGEVMDDIFSGSTPKANFLNENGDIQFLKVYNLCFDGTLNHSKDPVFIPNEIHNNQNKRAITKKGDVLINIVGPPLGKVSVIPESSDREFNINQAIVRFRPNDRILSKFLAYFLQNPVTIAWLSSTSKATAGQYNVKVTTCRLIPIKLPTVIEQLQIVQEIESRLSVCDNTISNIEEALEKSKALRQSILKKAFEGELLSKQELEQCRLEADWEPAEKLLEKIKKEKK